MTNPDPVMLHDLVQAWAERSPQASALLAPGRQPLSYVDLAGQVRRISLRLAQLGFKRGDRIAAALPGSAELAGLFLAVSSLCTIAPLNPASPLEDLIASLGSLKAAGLVLMQGEENQARTAASRLGIPVLDLEPHPTRAGLFTLHSDLAEVADPRTPTLAGPDDTAVTLLTSGTSSRPKIVPLTHRNIHHAIRNNQEMYGLTPADRCLNLAPLHHIALIAVIPTSIAAGASLVLPPGFAAHQVMDWFAEFKPTWYAAIPAVHKALLEQARLQPERLDGIHLRFARSASAPLPADVTRGLEETFGLTMLETYGMTEASSVIAGTRFPPRPRKAGSVGLPPGSSQVCILDEMGEPLPACTPGEICIRGGNVITGYENDPEANAAAFINGWLRTGDLGWVDEDGYVFITDRVKEIINRGGEKVSPREVDAVLLGHPAVKQAAAFAVPHPTLGEDVAAAVVLRPGQTATMQDLRTFAASRLADFKVPRQIVFVADVPKNPLGKPLRTGMAQRLKAELDALKKNAAGDGSAPRNETETILRSIWQTALNAQIGIHDDFLVAGGDSLMAARILLQVNEQFDTDLQLLDIFDAPTIASMAEIVRSRPHRQ